MHVGNTDRFVRYFPTLAFTLFFFLQKGVEACAGISPFQIDGLVKQWLYDYTRSPSVLPAPMNCFTYSYGQGELGVLK